MVKKGNYNKSQYNTRIGFHSLDLFGVTPKLFIDNSTTYKTNLGSFLTIILIFIFCGSCWLYGKEIIEKKNPNTTQLVQLTTNPERFDFMEQQFNFGFSLQTASGKHYIDESIYTMEFMKTYVTMDGENGLKFEEVSVPGRRCQLSDFDRDKEYYQKLGMVNDLYCLDDRQNVFLQGDYGQELFAVLSVKVFPCIDGESKVQCQPQDVIEQTLADNYWAIYFSDYAVDSKQHEVPFNSYGRSLYGHAEQNQIKYVEFNFRNVYIKDNTGLFFENYETKRRVEFSYEKETFQNKPGKVRNQFFQMNMRLEKNRETVIYRNYISIAYVIAQIGGILKVIMIILVAGNNYFSGKQLNLRVLNEIFQFNLNNNSKQKSSQLNQTNNNNGRNKKLKGQEIQDTWIFGQKEQKNLYNYAVRQIGDRLDLKYILQKLMEVDKLKMLLLSENQMRLFNYIPKPLISESQIENQKNMNSSEELSLDIQKDQTGSKKESEQEPNNKLNKEQEMTQSMKFNNLLLQKKLPQELQNKHAYQAFRDIRNKQKKSKIDKKIFDLMDQEIYSEFQEVYVMGQSQSMMSMKRLTQQQNKNNSNNNMVKNSLQISMDNSDYIDINRSTLQTNKDSTKNIRASKFFNGQKRELEDETNKNLSEIQDKDEFYIDINSSQSIQDMEESRQNIKKQTYALIQSKQSSMIDKQVQ